MEIMGFKFRVQTNILKDYEAGHVFFHTVCNFSITAQCVVHIYLFSFYWMDSTFCLATEEVDLDFIEITKWKYLVIHLLMLNKI